MSEIQRNKVKIVINSIKKYGVCSILLFLINVGTMILGGKRGYKIINNIFDEQEKGEIEDRNTREIGNDKVFWVKWKEKWCQNDENYRWFLELFIETYKQVENKCKKNKAKNFAFKFIYIVILLVFFIGLVFYCLWNMSHSENGISSAIENSVFFIIVVFALSIISKWLDIKQYQGTWARHYHHKYLLEKEMMLYINGFAPYNMDNELKRKERFIKNFLKIEDINEEKFIYNIEQKEVPIERSINFLNKKY